MIVLAAEVRDTNLTKGELNQLRRSGRVPAVVYGGGKVVGAVHVDGATFRKEILKLRQPFFQLSLEGKEYPALVRSVQSDPVHGKLLHVDFLAVQEDRFVDVEVPLQLEGTAIGVKEGGVLQTAARSLQIRSLPDRIPAELLVDVSKLAIGDSRTAGELDLPEGVKLMAEPGTVLVSVVPPQRTETKGGATTETTEEPAPL